MKRYNIFFIAFIIIIFMLSIIYYDYAKVKNIEALKNLNQKYNIVYIPSITDIDNNLNYKIEKDETITLLNQNVQISLRLSSYNIKFGKPGLVLNLSMENKNNFNIKFDLLNLKIGKLVGDTLATFYPEMDGPSLITIKSKHVFNKKLIYYPINNEKEIITHDYVGDLLKNYVIDLKEFKVGDEEYWPYRIQFTADDKMYNIYEKFYAREKKFRDYSYEPDHNQYNVFKDEGIEMDCDSLGVNLLKNGTLIKVNLFNLENNTFLKLKIVNDGGIMDSDGKVINTDLIIDASKIKLIDDTGKVYLSENRFKDLINKTPYVIDTNTYLLVGSERLDRIFVFSINNKSEELILDLSGILYKDGKKNLLPGTIKFKLQDKYNKTGN